MGVSNGRITGVRLKLEGTGLVLDTHSPGDGITRYKFGWPSEAGDSYFAMNPVHTALGIKEAEAFAAGVRTGWNIRDDEVTA